ncbi:MAG TPA: ABC transporter ATP-binding protein [Opitutaceae bacterium]|nr:ABC transporter ATP-binding protein [Opitutaceae bacterium]
MSDPVIRCENLGKHYTLRHAGVRPGYRTLREDLLHLPLRLLAAWRGGGREEEFWALRNVSFEVRSGEVLGIIGRNGAGKSTLLKILSRITAPSEGGVDLSGRVGSLLEVGTGFHPELTGRENIYLSGAMLGMRRHEVRTHFDEIVAFAEVEQFLDTPCKHYSSGMYTRLGFAVAAHLRTDILLVDEVLAVGDAEFQKRCLGKMEELSRNGRTVVIISHNLGIVQALCSRCLVLKEGRISHQAAATAAVQFYLAQGAISEETNVFRLPSSTDPRQAVIKRIEVSNWDATPNMLSAGPLQLVVDCALAAGHKGASLLLGVYDMLGNRVLFLDSTVIAGFSFAGHGNTQRVTIRLSRDFALRPGSYALNAALLVGGRIEHHIQNACRLEIAPGSFFETGRAPDSPVYVRQEWNVSTSA